jgi:eukaryotic translation initiation factor 2C
MRTKLGFNSRAPLNLSAVIVTKRHHTRFYPINAWDKDKYGNQNCMPGTCVDQLVTSPYYQDFYLQSHSGIKGTARPTHYFALQNDVPGMKLDVLRDLVSVFFSFPPQAFLSTPLKNFPLPLYTDHLQIHNLSYSYVRSMTPVSYVSPTYYADRLCERGRLYMRKYFNGDDQQLWDELATLKNRLEKELKAVREQRFPKTPQGKGSEERKMEREHAERVVLESKRFVAERVQGEFCAADAGNPWGVLMGNNMFWM